MRPSQSRGNKSAVLTSDHVNYMVYRYLMEAGFLHSAFTFAHESSIARAPVDPNNVAPGTLIAILQKGLQFMELEANLDGQDGDVDGEFKLLTPEELLTNDPDTLRQLVQERREGDKASSRIPAAGKRAAANAKDKDKPGRGGGPGPSSRTVPGSSPTPATRAPATRQPDTNMMDIDTPTPAAASEPAAAPVTLLQGHDGQLSNCSWHPSEPLVASGSEDVTARIWNVATGKSTVLPHDLTNGTEDERLVSVVEWSPDGGHLATGASDGTVRLWTKEGKLKQSWQVGTTTILDLKWNRKGDWILCGGFDGVVAVVDIHKTDVKSTIQLPQGAFTVDWRTHTSFAVGCLDTCVYFVSKVGDKDPPRKWSGHSGGINSVRWDPSGQLLASGADDQTARIWSFKSGECLHTLSHPGSVACVRWAPAGTANSQAALLATTSDAVRVWSSDTGACLQTLGGAVGDGLMPTAWSPNGKLIAVPTEQGTVQIQSAADGTVVRTCALEVSPHEMAWQQSGDRLALCVGSKLAVVDVKGL